MQDKVRIRTYAWCYMGTHREHIDHLWVRKVLLEVAFKLSLKGLGRVIAVV